MFVADLELVLRQFFAEAFNSFIYAAGVDVGDYQEEFVAAETAANVRRANDGFQNVREFLEQGVAAGVAVGVIDGFEGIQIGEDHQ